MTSRTYAPRMDEEVVPVLHVEDAGRAVVWYQRLGFRKEWEHQFEPAFPWFVSVARGNVRLYLSEHKGDARPNTLIHLYVTDIDTVAQEFGVPIDEEASPAASARSKIPTATDCVWRHAEPSPRPPGPLASQFVRARAARSSR